MNPLLSRATPAVVKPKTEKPVDLRDFPASFWTITPPQPKPAPRRRTAREDLQRKAEALNLVLATEPVATHEEPAELVSTANMRGASRQAVMAKASGTKSQRALGARIARKFNQYRPLDAGNAFAVVHLCRIAPRELDSDNLEGAFKGTRDGIATGLGLNDRSPRVRYVVSQEQGEPRQHCVRAELFISTSHQGEADGNV